MVASSHSSQPRRVARLAAACRVLAITIAVLSLGGRSLASHVVAASTTAIAASSAEWRALAAVHGGLERGTEAGWAGRERGDSPPTLLPLVASWELGPATLARVLSWAPTSTELPPEGRAVARVARGPPASTRS